MKIRGYWLKDLKEVFERSPPTVLNWDKWDNPITTGLSASFRVGQVIESCPTSQSPETRTSTALSQLSQSEEGKDGEQLGFDL